jgi:hypothetical protein
VSATPDANGRAPLQCWLDAPAAASRLRPYEVRRVEEARADCEKALSKKPRPQPGVPRPRVTAGHVVASLTFGFWSRLLHDDYANWRQPDHYLWGLPDLPDRAFPHCPMIPGTRRREAHRVFTEIKEFRNRTFHHERILQHGTVDFYDGTLAAVAWICPATAATLRQQDRPRVVQVISDGWEPYLTELEAVEQKLHPGYGAVAPAAAA